MVLWWVLLVACGVGAIIGIILVIAGIAAGEAGAGCGGSVLTVISGFLVYLALANLFFTGWPLGPGLAHKSTPTAKVSPSPCGLNYVYDSLVDMGTSWSVQYSTSVQNNTSSSTPATFHSNVATTVTITDDLGVTVTGGARMLNVIEASVQSHVNSSVTQSITLQIGVDEQYVIPPHSTANAIYGVKVQVVGGHLYTSKDSCNQISWGQVVTYVPLSSGWCIWLNSETPCPHINAPPPAATPTGTATAP